MGIRKSIQLFSDSFVKVLGDIKVFSWPFYVLYDPGSYQVKGDDMRKLISVVQPGDIMVRGYKNYLDGYLIPGYFSHVGLYLGSVKDEDIDYLRPRTKRHLKTGEQMVIHSMAEGVFMEDVLSFCFCDYMAVMRFPRTIFRHPNAPVPDFALRGFSQEEKDYIQDLSSGKELQFETVWPIIYRLALAQLGRPYDFGFNFKNFNNMSCTEFVYFCTKSLWWCIGVVPYKKRIALINKEILEPDIFVASKLDLVWHSRSINADRIKKLRAATTPEPAPPPPPVAVSPPTAD